MPVQPPPSDNNPHRRHYSSGSSSSPSARPILAHVAQAAAARSAIKEEQQHWANINKSNTDLGSSSSDIARARKNSLTPSAPGLSMSASGMAQEEAAWKVIGRRSSTSVPAISDTQQDENNRTEQYPQMHDESDDPALSHQRAFRARAASTPNPLMVAENKSSSADYPPGLGPTEPEQSGAGSGTWNGPGMAWGASQSSIWKGTTSASAGSTPIDNNKTAYFPSDIASTTASFPSRQYRSFSFSLGSMRGLEPYEEEGGESFDRDRVTTLPLRGGDDNDDDEPYDPTAIPKMRSRSKSSSEIYGLLSGQESRYTYPPDRSASPVSPPGAGDYGDVNSIWAATQGTAAGRAHDAATAMMHRRPSAQAGVHWESMRGNGQGNDNGMGGPSADQLDRYRQQRRFSHAPGLYNDFSQQMMSSRPQGDHADISPYDLARRRHSLAGPLYGSSAPDFLSAGMDRLGLDDPSDTPFLDEIDDYFENTKRRTKAWVEAGKNLQAQSYSHQWPLYVVEFKAGRTDFFHVTDMSGMPIKKGDLVIVEADRGKDLGKVIQDNIQSVQQLQLYQAQHADTLVDSHSVNKEVHPKRIFRSAAPSEVTMLVSKSQDEAKAMALCQTKIRQKKMPMEIVDAEYQWDRRKLTFYFVADRRIDFRELVRELFKIYKTRIWMCAVNPMKPLLPQ